MARSLLYLKGLGEGPCLGWSTKGKYRPLRAVGQAVDRALKSQGEGQPQGPALPPPVWIFPPLEAIGQMNS